MSTTQHPFRHFSTVPVSRYPLTDGELAILADRWWDVAYELGTWMTLWGSYGGAEGRDRDYALDRLELLKGVLGEHEIDRIHIEVEARWKEQLGEDCWAAYKQGRAIFQEESEAEEDGE
jgi:hypothetical protein